MELWGFVELGGEYMNMEHLPKPRTECSQSQTSIHDLSTCIFWFDSRPDKFECSRKNLYHLFHFILLRWCGGVWQSYPIWQYCIILLRRCRRRDRERMHIGTNQRPASWSPDHSWPIRCQHLGHSITFDQSEASILLTNQTLLSETSMKCCCLSDWGLMWASFVCAPCVSSAHDINCHYCLSYT